MSRYVVTELEGFGGLAVGGGKPGLSCHVIDTLWNHRLIATYRTEPYASGGLKGHRGAPKRAAIMEHIRTLARDHADRLNELYG